MRAAPGVHLVRWIAPPQKKIGYTKARLQRELLHAARSWRKIGFGARLSSMGCGASKARSGAKYEELTSESGPIMDTNLEHGHEPCLTVRLIMKMRETNIWPCEKSAKH